MTGRLIDPDDSALIIIDVQPGFLERVEACQTAGLVERIAFLAAAARFLGIPLLATVEEPERWGLLVPPLVSPLDGHPVLRKGVFGLADDPKVFPAFNGFCRKTAVLTGMETDVCVAHSALGLLDRGYRVVCVGDAVASPGAAHEWGLARMRTAGAEIVSTKQLFFEWMRTVERSVVFRQACPDVDDPPGVLR